MKSSNVCPNVLISFKCFTDTLVPIETTIRVEGVSNSTRDDFVARDKPISAKGNSVIGTFVTQFSTMTENVLHGETQFVVNTNHRLLTSKCQLHVGAGLDRARQIPAACMES